MPLPLAALIAAQDQTDIGDGLRATLPLAGRTLVEYQAGLLLAAGATHVVLLVERVPATLAQAVDRLRRSGARIEVARSLADAIDRFHPDERVLLAADGAVAAQDAVGALAQAAAPALLTIADLQDNGMFERIDAEDRWAGFALFRREDLDATARMLGDWDLCSTLLRRLVQAGAARIAAIDPTGDRPLPPPVLATGPAAIGAVEATLLRRAEPGDGDWVERYVHRLTAAPMIGPLIARQVDQLHVAWAGVGLAWLGATLAGFGLFWPALLLLPTGAALASAARRMARIWGGGAEQGMLPHAGRLAAAGVVLALLARMLASEGDWGWWLIAALVPAALAGLAALDPIMAAIRAQPAPRWLAGADALIWVAPPLALLGGWRWMLAGLAAYAGLSFVQRFTSAYKGARTCDNEELSFDLTTV